jgi:hypothetical protein
MPDELVPKVMNIFVDSKMIFALLDLDRPGTERKERLASDGKVGMALFTEKWLGRDHTRP